MEGCKECVYINALTNEVAELKTRVNDLSGKVVLIERNAAVNEEQTKMIFKILGEIKDSIEKIANKIEDIESRPSKLLWGVLGTIAGALIIAGIKFIK